MIASLIVAVLMQAAVAQPCDVPARASPSPSLIVQAVDPVWLPLPGVEVTIAPAAGGAKTVVSTSKNGYAQFRLAPEQFYTIELTHPGFKKKTMKRFRAVRGSDSFPTAYVQLQLQVSGPFITVN